MKIFMMLAFLLSGSAFAQYWGDYDYVCQNDYFESYFVKTSSPVVVAFQPVRSHPEIISDMEVKQERVLRGRCIELCLEIPFVDALGDQSGESLLSLRSKGGVELAATLTSPDGSVSKLKCTKY